MKVLDPQSALLTTAEVHHFLSTSPLRRPDPPVGGFPTINLQGYRNVRKDFAHYTATTSPHINSTPPSTWLPTALKRFKRLGLTKAEALQMVNVGVGLPSSKPSLSNGATAVVIDDGEEMDVPGEETATRVDGNSGADMEIKDEDEEGQEKAEVGAPDRDLTLLSVVVEECESRFSLEERRELLRVLQESIEEAERDGEDSGMGG